MGHKIQNPAFFADLFDVFYNVAPLLLPPPPYQFRATKEMILFYQWGDQSSGGGGGNTGGGGIYSRQQKNFFIFYREIVSRNNFSQPFLFTEWSEKSEENNIVFISEGDNVQRFFKNIF